MVYFWLPRLLQSTEPVVDRVDAAHINAAQIDSGQAVEPPRQRVEAVTLKEAQRIGLICRVRQEQRHHAVQAIDVIDPLLGRQPLQGLDAVTRRREAPANSGKKNGEGSVRRRGRKEGGSTRK